MFNRSIKKLLDTKWFTHVRREGDNHIAEGSKVRAILRDTPGGPRGLFTFNGFGTLAGLYDPKHNRWILLFTLEEQIDVTNSMD